MNKENVILEILSAKDQGTRYGLSHATFHLGRASDNDIILDDKRTSRHHAQISYEEGAYWISDLNTANGTWVNKHKILNQKLHHGDVIQIGSYAFRFLHHEALESTHLSLERIGARPSSAPQKEIISRTQSMRQSRKIFRSFLYTGAGLILLLLAWILSPNVEDSKKPASSKIQEAESPVSRALPKLSSEAYSINWEKANQFYLSGYRELISLNYLRALDDFKTALELYPDHRLAKIYLKKTEDALIEDVNQHYKSAINYFNSAQYLLAIHHFTRVIGLLQNRRPPEGFCSVRAEKKDIFENPDFEKYCESQEKISQAQSLLTSEQGF